MSAPLLAELLGAAHDGGAFPGESHHPLVRVSYRDNPAVQMTVYLIHRWERSDISEPIESASGGFKDYIRNYVYELFGAHPRIAAVMLVASQYHGGAFCLLAVGESGTVYDMARQAVEVEL